MNSMHVQTDILVVLVCCLSNRVTNFLINELCYYTGAFVVFNVKVTTCYHKLLLSHLGCNQLNLKVSLSIS